MLGRSTAIAHGSWPVHHARIRSRLVSIAPRTARHASRLERLTEMFSHAVLAGCGQSGSGVLAWRCKRMGAVSRVALPFRAGRQDTRACFPQVPLLTKKEEDCFSGCSPLRYIPMS